MKHCCFRETIHGEQWHGRGAYLTAYMVVGLASDETVGGNAVNDASNCRGIPTSRGAV